MSKEKTLEKVLSGQSDNNVSFSDLKNLMIALGFQERIRGDHFIYTKENIYEIINLQPLNNKSKPYQVKQVRNIILKYKLKL
jgi:hypothetical protein